MRAAELYAIAIADAVLEGKATIPTVPMGEDDFVELDAEGRPKSAPEGRRPAPAKRPPRKSAGAPAGATRGRAPKAAKGSPSGETGAGAAAAGTDGGADAAVADASGDAEA